MINTKEIFTTYGINPNSTTSSVQEIGRLVNQGTHGVIDTVIMLAGEFAGVDVTADQFNIPGRAKPEAWALTFMQAIIEYCVKQGHDVVPQEVAEYAWNRTNAFMGNARHQWMFATDEQPSAAPTMSVHNKSTETTTKVEIKADGKIKKGGKETMAVALYQKFLEEKAARNEGPLKTDNKAFIDILIDKLGMTKAGATTYAYNMRKKFSPELIKEKTK